MKYEREIITPIGHYVGVCKGEFLPTPDGSIGINKDVETMLTNFRKEMNDRMAAAVVRGFNPFIEEFFSNREPLSIDDFTDETFVKDCKIVANGCSPYTPSFLKALYGYVFENGYGSFEILNQSIINYNSVIRLINSGYTLIVYNPTSPIPESDKWLLWDGNRVIDFDFSSINTENKAIALKSYIWIDRSSSLKNRCKLMGKYVSFLNIMSNESLKVSVKDVMTFKNSLSDLSSASKAVYSNSVLDFVRYIKTVFEADVSQLTLDAFSSENTKSKPFKDSYSSEQMQQIFAGMDAKIANAKGEMHDYYALAKLLTQIVNETPVRGENVQNLTLNCIEKAPETNHYYLHYNPKNFNGTPLIKKIDEGTLFINIPKIKQFRVYLASELNRRGYNEFAIASLLSHKDEKMLGYYARPIAKSEEDKIYRDMFLRDVIEDDLKIIGPKGDEYTARIKAYLEKNKKIDVRSNLREIGNDIDGLMPMKVIPVGFCICPAPKMSCEATNKDNADSIYCAYGLCSNQSHLYYDMPFHMDQFHNCIDSVQYNIENQYEQEAEKELYKAQFICKTLLLPELNELKELIERKGSDYIIQKHPEMETIINDMSNIEKEILKWEKITIEKVKQLQKKRKSKK